MSYTPEISKLMSCAIVLASQRAKCFFLRGGVVSLEDKRLRDLVEADIQQLIVSGVAEHLYLEYKSDLYGENRVGRKEFLLDVCMFANAQGGVLLIGVAEERRARAAHRPA